MNRKANQKKAQSILEYSLLIGVSVGVLLIMWNYTNRSLQGKLKSSGDSLGGDYSTHTQGSTVTKKSCGVKFEDGLTPIGLVISSGSSSRTELTHIGPLTEE